MNMKLRKGQQQTFDRLTNDETTALKSPKVRLVEPPLLPHPRSRCDYTVAADANDKEIKYALLKKQPDRTGRPTGYWFRSHKDGEHAYNNTHQGFFSMVWAVLLFLSDVEVCQLTVTTDHNALKWILNLTDLTGKLVFWRLRLSEFKFEVVHHAGTKHQASDALLRPRMTGTDQTDLQIYSSTVHQPLKRPKKKR